MRKSEYLGKRTEEFAFKEVLYDKKDGIARITINRPNAYNSYTLLTLKELYAAFLDAMVDDRIGVIVLSGAGDKAFCTGGDVKEYAENYIKHPRDFWKWMWYFNQAHDLIRNCGKVVIARVNGMVVGGGNEFHMSCDLSIAAEHSYIRQVGTRVGSVAAGGATQFLPIIVGDRRAREILFLCEEISARKAEEWGLINQVVPSVKNSNGEFLKLKSYEDISNALKNKENKIDLSLLDNAINEMAKKLLNKFPECTRYTKQQLNFLKDFIWSMTIGHARDWLSIHFSSPEVQEGMCSFVEKRKTEYEKIRKALAEGKSAEYLWGANVKECKKCGIKYLPEEFEFCGKCGNRL